jgi:YebC/PmpR family DNA-binding regulatory protein
MSGHNKWSKIKRQKGASDAQKSKIFSKLVRFITVEAKKSGGNLSSPGLAAAIKKAKEANMPNDTIDRAVKKGATDNSSSMETITYEAYGPGGCALIIEALTDNRNKASQDVKHILAKNGFSLAGIGSVTWAFTRENGEWVPQTTVQIGDEDGAQLETLLNELEDTDEVQEVYNNAE